MPPLTNISLSSIHTFITSLDEIEDPDSALVAATHFAGLWGGGVIERPSLEESAQNLFALFNAVSNDFQRVLGRLVEVDMHMPTPLGDIPDRFKRINVSRITLYLLWGRRVHDFNTIGINTSDFFYYDLVKKEIHRTYGNVPIGYQDLFLALKIVPNSNPNLEDKAELHTDLIALQRGLVIVYPK